MNGETYTENQHIVDLGLMIAADRGHMYRALEEGRYRAAERFRRAIAANQSELKRLTQ